MDGLNLVPAPQNSQPVTLSAAYALAEELGACSGAPASAAWPSANLAIAVPLPVDAPGFVQQIWWVNGAAVSGHVEVAITDEFGNKIASTGSVVPSGTNVPQAVTLASPVLLLPGRYYLVVSCDNGTQAFFAYAAAAAVTNINRFLGLFEQATAFPIPSPMVPASSARSYVPLAGIDFATTTL